MNSLCRVLATILIAVFLAPTAVHAQSQPATVSVASGVKYELLGRWDVDKLNTILTRDTPAFSGVDASYTPARKAIPQWKAWFDSP